MKEGWTNYLADFARKQSENISQSLTELQENKATAGVAGFLEREAEDVEDMDFVNNLNKFKIMDESVREHYENSQEVRDLPVSINSIYGEYKRVQFKTMLRRGVIKKLERFIIEKNASKNTSKSLRVVSNKVMAANALRTGRK